MYQPSSRAIIAISFLCFAAVAAYSIFQGFSVTGPARHLDGKVMFIAAHSLAQGTSPYDLDAYSALWQAHFGVPRREPSFFPYPFTMFPIVYPLSFFDWHTARHLIDAANLVSLGAIFWAIAVWVRDLSTERQGWMIWAALALAALFGSISATLTLGQSSLVAMAGFSWAAVFARRLDRNILFGIAVLIASIKPQMTFVPVLAIMLLSSRRYFLSAIAVMLVTFAVTLMVTGWQVVPQFIEILSAYGSYSANQGPSIVGASFLASLTGHSLSLPLALLLAILTTAVFLWIPWRDAGLRIALQQGLFSQRVNVMTVSGIVLCSSFWMPLHGYDLVIYTLPLVLLTLRDRQSMILLLPGFLAVARPNAMVAMLGHTVNAQLVQSLAMLYVLVATFYLVAAVPREGREKHDRSLPRVHGGRVPP